MVQCECAVDEVMPDCPIHGERPVIPPEERCRPVEVDGEVIRIHGEREMNDADRRAFAEVVRAARRKLEHASLSGDEGPIEELGRMPTRWRCDECGTIIYSSEVNWGDTEDD